MSTPTISLPADQHERLRALAEFDVELRFRARAAKGDPEKGLAILDALDARHAG